MSDTISTILSLQCTRVGVSVPGKADVLGCLSDLLTPHVPGTSREELLEGFVRREQMGSTGIGGGIAIPHCRSSHCSETLGALIRLEEPVEFDSIDSQPVDLVFALLGPEGDAQRHLRALGLLAERFGHAAYIRALREAHDHEALYEAAVGAEPG